MSDAIPGTLLLDPDVLDDPYPFYDRLREEAPVWVVPGTKVVIINSFEMICEASARVEDFSNNMSALLYRGDDGLPAQLSFGGGADGITALANADPPIHAIQRRAVFPDLVAKRMDALEPDVVDLASRSIDTAIEAGHVDFMAAVGNVIPITMISRLIGFRDSNLDALLQAAFDSTLMLGVAVSLDEIGVLMARSNEIGEWITDQIMHGEADDDLLGTVKRAVDAEVITIGEGNIILHTLLSAGGESTTSLIGNAVRILAEQPELQQQLRDDPTLVPAFVEEAVRLESPFRYLLRATFHDTAIGGVDIESDSSVLMFWGAANRDPAEYDRADQVVLDREVPRHHVAFGRGIHHCVGAPLARLEARSVIGTLLEKTRAISLDENRPPVRVRSLLVRRHEQLPVVLEPR
jgi:cytochrome P450